MNQDSGAGLCLSDHIDVLGSSVDPAPYGQRTAANHHDPGFGPRRIQVLTNSREQLLQLA